MTVRAQRRSSGGWWRAPSWLPALQSSVQGRSENPHPNIKNAVLNFVALETPLANLSRLNSLASPPQMLGSWWIDGTGNVKFAPSGYLMPPSSISLRVVLWRKIPDGYNLITSWRIIVTYDSSHHDLVWFF
ncbi:Os01g0728375 [Oryza sativa Japonica Group]|uniref:Os01g0728375 protein n=1 Tax=Oryza sativa subsp. japonica TaxID=39947 RepID=A0A0P0V7U8_ORYSJ|nr:hypothetical protein EE612_005486 [Oryza sativa]BAS74152.1 Os01g0728375 [Oryza sativa Japonica Group]